MIENTTSFVKVHQKRLRPPKGFVIIPVIIIKTDTENEGLGIDIPEEQIPTNLYVRESDIQTFYPSIDEETGKEVTFFQLLGDLNHSVAHVSIDEFMEILKGEKE